MITSTRAHELLKELSNKLPEAPLGVSFKDIFWKFTLGENSNGDYSSVKFLSLSFFTSSTHPIELLILESVSRFVKDRDLNFLINLRFRELENFLRDENHLPVFSSDSGSLAEESFEKTKNSLVLAAIYGKISTFVNLENWHEKSLIDKNKSAKNFIFALNSLFKTAIPLELVLAENDEISIIANSFPLSMIILNDLFNLSIGNSLEISSLKVVAVQ